MLSFEGADFPAFFDTLSRAVDAIDGDLIYAVKPRLTSLGAALLANHLTGKPIFLEANDLETVVGSPTSADRHAALPLSALIERAEEARVPYADIWSQLLDACAQEIPNVFTHNVNLDMHYGRRSYPMRNVKDETVYDPAAYDREAVRAELGFGPEDRVILFGGMVRRHKGVFELLGAGGEAWGALPVADCWEPGDAGPARAGEAGGRPRDHPSAAAAGAHGGA